MNYFAIMDKHHFLCVCFSVLFLHGSTTFLPLRGKSTHIQFQTDQVSCQAEISTQNISANNPTISDFGTFQRNISVVCFQFCHSHDFDSVIRHMVIASIFDMFTFPKDLDGTVDG